eukprot:CAMPEP_0201489422 /NCGR_PEP_ID=MMETSP0151_2-20130828/22793_1 /ASSEMBLY_ACC=CAM_ASM_000257 /TAXON_ID=200890 /ORGANISM="Paramoeba atlantica, Strain 621/1 / CCAP 1560/9" /LENGTH=153 /DNA_ID=CAMNT_0047875021 /DNA_START=95 /DNA_END=557 /DNA_ORIENTATION=+
MADSTQLTPHHLVGIFSEDGGYRLDIGIQSMKEEIPASHDSWATRFVIKRLDGPNRGPISSDHVVGIFSVLQHVRLDIGSASVKKQVSASHESWATRLWIKRLASDDDGALRYGEVVGIFSENGRCRLDIGIRAVKKKLQVLMNLGLLDSEFE